MRTLLVMACALVFASPIYAATAVTVKQLEHFLTSSGASRLSDQEMADRLSEVILSEQLTAGTLNRIRMESTLGPNSEEQLDLLAAESMFATPPANEFSMLVAPTPSEQERIVQLVRNNARHALSLLPDFIAIRSTRYFTNIPVDDPRRHTKPRIQMHLARESKSEVAFQNGHEVKRTLDGKGSASEVQTGTGGLSTWGEFGAILRVVLGDTSGNNLQWSRWQQSDSGNQLAVFRYTIPRKSSHYTVDFCCFQKSLDEPVDYEFHEKPGYGGEIHVDPVNGEINRITLDAQLEDGPVTRSAIAVQYGPVVLGGKHYVCPLWSIAISDFHNALIEKIDGIGTEQHLNETEFTDYHKFGSSTRILSGAFAAPNN